MSREWHEQADPAPWHTDWLRHELAVSGPGAEVAAFQAAALGAAAIPWHLDLDAEEARLLAPMATHGAEARGLARALRQAVGAHHERVLNQVRRARACPLDLHRLVPVPDAILRLGPDDPASERWLRAHWGTLQALRHARVLDAGEDRRRTRTARVVLEFHAADWSPWQALLRLRQDWPRLLLDLRPDYGDG
ncbi:MAG: hypothetical protein ACRYG6_02055 [Janthinobacterium lividum]